MFEEKKKTSIDKFIILVVPSFLGFELSLVIDYNRSDVFSEEEMRKR